MNQIGLFDEPKPWIYTAKYNKNLPPNYSGNPLIEAMTPLKSDAQLFDALYETIEDPDLTASTEVRAHFIVENIKKQFVLFPSHFELAKKIDLMMRSGYVDRNPSKRNRNALLQEMYEQSQAGGKPVNFNSRAKGADSILITGYPGCGKSTAAERILGLNLQVVEHKDLNIIQVMYLKIECPHDSQLKTLCANFMQALDDALGTDYAGQVGRREGVNSLLQQMKNLVAQYNVGILIIDEFQNLNSRKNDSSELLRFIVSLVNTIQLPVVFMGTPDAGVMFENRLASARRAIGHGSIDWNPLRLDFEKGVKPSAETNELWITFTDALFENCWLTKQTALDEELRTVWFELSVGVIDIAVKLFIASQLIAISSGNECITVELMKHVYKHEFKPVHDLLDALRDNDRARLALFDDLAMKKLDKHIFQMPEKVFPIRPEAMVDKDKVEKLARVLKENGIDVQKAQEASVKLCTEYPNTSLKTLAEMAISTLPKVKKKRLKKEPEIDSLPEKEVNDALKGDFQSLFDFDLSKPGATK
ncbi:ATP-binding protein [uncultured Alteromonas sp.]|jgi:ATP:corrinoid adenosyltransferase|uniref:ATP-binding protein n=1 Tax=uncultured Alteromonas sp. TaxID=179113 RepID=UPI00258D2F93|nr:ATP-binding protein [uncultured Alteromonas sp.]|tara:strand:- start:1670 stop:3265 length:1596 start_codon:yes stop_codon:yes gene_type:complete